MKKFLLRVTGDATEFASVLPVVQAILNENEDNQVAIVYNDGLELEDFWLPSRCWAYPISKKETESMFAAHKFAANLHDIFNTDYYIDFISDMYSAFLGLAFRANIKIGLQGGPKSFFYQVSLPEFSGEFLDEKKVSSLNAIEGDFNNPAIDNSFTHQNIRNIFISFPHKMDVAFIEKINFIAECLPTIKLHGYISSQSVDIYDAVKVHGAISLFSESSNVLARRIDEFDGVITDNLAIAQMSRNRGQLAFLICDEDDELPQWKYMPESIGRLNFSGSSLLSYGISETISLKAFPDLEDYILNYQSLRLVP
ncbi:MULTISPECIES: hypothetical protein [Halobacteriovorax]|uniref:Uncharacterized protein n=1 Tax=Halobacteriovorax vibrionivorans TaxID=2152716 RepID=A0ABY0IJY2_9BACT|nr:MULTISPECIES: hypothetical protein [Halobacteriovorax]RZF22141.1 hypothetical protein DAY19_10690 [Halobacteriovorax vibrionivorans]TGD47159.1 hypothetical protein EP118_09125 [Halobacteriovorax sp. Y22]